jgi:hypothetical protein
MQNASVPADSAPRCSLRRYLTDGIKSLLKSAAAKLKDSARRRFLAETVRELGPDGQGLAERELGWNRGTIRKGMHELTADIECMDAFCLRGRKPSENHLPNLFDDIRDIIEPNAHVDATLRTPVVSGNTEIQTEEKTDLPFVGSPVFHCDFLNIDIFMEIHRIMAMQHDLESRMIKSLPSPTGMSLGMMIFPGSRIAAKSQLLMLCISWK